MQLHTCTFYDWNDTTGGTQGNPAAASLIVKKERQITG